MTVPELPGTDWDAINKRLDQHIRKPDGSGYSALAPNGPNSIKAFMGGVRLQQDKLEGAYVQLGDHKGDIDKQAEEIASLKRRVSALEVAPPSHPFPIQGSG